MGYLKVEWANIVDTFRRKPGNAEDSWNTLKPAEVLGQSTSKTITSVPLEHALGDSGRKSLRLWAARHQLEEVSGSREMYTKREKGLCLLNVGTVSSSGPGVRFLPRRELEGEQWGVNGEDAARGWMMTFSWGQEGLPDRTLPTHWPSLTGSSLRPPGGLALPIAHLPAQNSEARDSSVGWWGHGKLSGRNRFKYQRFQIRCVDLNN